MKDTIQTLITRRSCRSYKEEQIKDEELKIILEAGTYAPTGMGKQSPIILVIQDEETRKKLTKINAKIAGDESRDTFYNAPTILLVMADKNIKTYIEDGSLVLGNMMNAAAALNVGSCWIHRAKEELETEEGQKLLEKWGIPDNFVGIGHCILGYAKESAKGADERKKDYIRYIK